MENYGYLGRTDVQSQPSFDYDRLEKIVKENANASSRADDIIIEEPKPYHRGYYTGCFDMFHIGHLRSIQNATKLCDQLVVAVSTDEVIREYKHTDPVIPFEQRLEIVENIKGVTLAVPQYDLHDKLGPAFQLGCDVIFSSEEYQRSSYDGREMSDKELKGVERWEKIEADANANDMEVVYLPRTQGISTTDIRNKIAEQITPTEMIYSEGEVYF